MNRHHRLLQTEELHSEFVHMIKSSITGIQKEIYHIKKFLGDRKTAISKKSRETSIGSCDTDNTLEFTRLFYEHLIDELIDIERACEECLVRLNIDLLTATKDRMQPPSYLSPEELRRAFEMCYDRFEETKDEPSCRCFWENKPVWDLEDTHDILIKPKEEARTEFDETDVKFRQDIVYLRSKMFSLPSKRTGVKSGIEIISGSVKGRKRLSIQLSLKTSEFIRMLKKNEAPIVFSVPEELSKLSSLKFIDGKFITSDIWTKILDVHGEQYGSKWYLVLCPQIEKICKQRFIAIMHLNPQAAFNFISRITGHADFILTKADLIVMLQNQSESVWLTSWKLQLQLLEGPQVAATIIQTYWRGYWLRKRKWYTGRLYIAASLIWYYWLTYKERKDMHRRYLEKMLVSMQTTRELTLKLSNEFNMITTQPHVVIHLPSIGNPVELRRVVHPKMFTIYQNLTILRICFVRNPKTEVIYVLPVNPTQDLLMMYSDFIESIAPEEDFAKRITFVALSQSRTFEKRSMNVSRLLHCSEDSLEEIRKKIAGKPAFFLPAIVDECDMRLAGNLNVPLLSLDMELQRMFLNVSNMSAMIDEAGLLQPPHERNIRDYPTLCNSMSELIVLHTEVSVWTFKLNYGMAHQYNGIFLINHISIPFMPMLRREREKHGDDWKTDRSLRQMYLEKLREHLPKVIPTVTRLSKMYKTWMEFSKHIQKYGCMLQAIPMEKQSKTVLVTLFIPGKATKQNPKWLGTADKIILESTYSSIIYMIPQSTIDIAIMLPTINKFARCMQDKGYFGYITVDCYCYVRKQDEEMIMLLLNVYPYYSYVQSCIDWMKFAIGGWYNRMTDEFTSDVSIISHAEKRKPSFVYPDEIPKWNETTERFAVVITQLYHSRLAAFRWSSLKDLFESCGIMYDRKKRQGSSIILHDGEIRTFAKMVTVSSSMTTTLSMVHKNLTKLNHTLTTRSRKRKIETNLPPLINLFLKFSLDYQNLVAKKCMPGV